ncbi:hypothetical protein DFAR_1470039 [Desulfarculales bacterium]
MGLVVHHQLQSQLIAGAVGGQIFSNTEYKTFLRDVQQVQMLIGQPKFKEASGGTASHRVLRKLVG